MCSRDYSPMVGCHDAERLVGAWYYASQKRNQSLYRYRSVSVNSLEGLLFGYIFAGFASRFNDPLDCKPIVNRNELLMFGVIAQIPRILDAVRNGKSFKFQKGDSSVENSASGTQESN